MSTHDKLVFFLYGVVAFFVLVFSLGVYFIAGTKAAILTITLFAAALIVAS